MSDWGTLDGGAARAADPPPRPTAGRDAWGVLDGRPAAQPGQAGATVPRQAAPNSARPSPEATASVLNAGDTVWAKVERTSTTLGAGQVVTLVATPADGIYGWRPIRILDPARLTAEVVPVPQATLAAGVGDDPLTLYRPDAPAAPAGVPRAMPFPAGVDPHLRSLVDDGLADVRERYERKAADASAHAERRVRDAAEHYRAAADQRIGEVERQAWADQDDLRRRISEQEQRIRDLEATVRQLRQGGGAGYGFGGALLTLVSLAFAAWTVS
ncbi:hypothetical protein KZZ52_13775 [Dactylosporangium sp. AC04546]|uniref:hypothetical protein n=1 Tax=Dactylosporangium sp. AC04546 TaxID=2862460 RepID=UPI001EE0E198|nr:hypothetical protein [Dactylosporangium sp. AC04546]WVK86397.1 hypothetical protein KZZ52_13775 [Dactylosporangium sp. AC04546]